MRLADAGLAFDQESRALACFAGQPVEGCLEGGALLDAPADFVDGLGVVPRVAQLPVHFLALVINVVAPVVLSVVVVLLLAPLAVVVGERLTAFAVVVLGFTVIVATPLGLHLVVRLLVVIVGLAPFFDKLHRLGIRLFLRVFELGRQLAVVAEQGALYSVEPNWPGDTFVALSFADGRLSMGVDSSASTILTITNLGNADLTGSLYDYGNETGLLVVDWVRMSDDVAATDFSLTAGSSVDFKLTITSNTARSGSTELTVHVRTVGEGVLTKAESVPLPISIEGPALPPNGLSALGVDISQSAAFATMGAGWLLAIVAIQLLRRRGSDGASEDPDTEDDSEEDDEKELPELGYNECRLDGESKVNCPTCDARLGVPRGSTPPFRFTCPQCENKIRVVE